MRRRAALVLFLSAAMAPTLSAQGLAEAAARANKERKGTPTKVYTNDDLLDARNAPDRPAAPAAARAIPSPATPSAAPTMDPSQRWRRDAKQRRDAVAGAEAKVAGIQARLDALLVDRNPTNVMDPSRLQTQEAERAKAMQELETAKAGLEKARQDLEDFEEEARRAGVPPGWLREP